MARPTEFVSARAEKVRLLLGRGHAIIPQLFGAAQAAHYHREVVLAPGRHTPYVRMLGRK
eukprot:5041691-Prymnesium_polylepis.1